MRDSVWLFLYLLLKQTAVNEAGEGVVNYGHPITKKEIEEQTGFHERRIEDWINRLRRTFYIRTESKNKDGLIFFIKAAKNKHRLARNNVPVDTLPARNNGTVPLKRASQGTENKTISMIGGSPTPKSLSSYNKDAAPTAGAGVTFSDLLKAKTPPKAYKSQKEVEAECKRQMDAMRAKGLIQ